MTVSKISKARRYPMPSGVTVAPVAAARAAAGRAVVVGSVPRERCPATQSSTAATAGDSSPQTDSLGVGLGRLASAVMPGSCARATARRNSGSRALDHTMW